ncbi:MULTISPECIES: cell division protein FtsQ/DivIB [unclassified Meiothermus]|uniref:cell division protein FtsQ/DivIB n=1 Tax=unclassified Meiothermus TaxID=370471 RepID=UPI000D7C56AD|nr:MULTISPECIES: FtsQ-type POTRA domain-containing protein [unclassified Meiothermus]PZA07803.1 cell division protein FtsQ [Meiothermus sp. Pnk-1]RYM38895.1 FtsQ-type POTRA domain-containing protein [Meiothermus sp. PNK-Is4]
MIVRLLLIVLGLATLGVASRVLLPTEEVVVVGNHHLSAAEVRKRTGLEPGTPWLWAWPYKLKGLEGDPWVKQARLERPKAGKLRIVLEERQPIATLVRGEQRQGLAADGTFLPKAALIKPVLEGVGVVPVRDLLVLIKTFPKVQKISFNPAGYSLEWEGVRVWGPNIMELQRWAQGGKMGASIKTVTSAKTVASAMTVNVYSWGVSQRR